MGEPPVLEAGHDGVGVLFICVTVNHEIVLVVRQDVVEGNRDRLFAPGIESQAAGFERIVCDDLAGTGGPCRDKCPNLRRCGRCMAEQAGRFPELRNVDV